MKIAIVILNWNGKKLLEKFLPLVVNYSQEANVYVADNASTDDSVAFVKTNFPTVKIIQNTENGGYAKGYNDALKHLSEDVYCLLNSDIEVTRDWLQPIIKTFKNSTDKECAAIQPKILDYKDKTKFEYAGAAGGFIDKFGYPYCKGRIFNSIEHDINQYNTKDKIFWASGACMFIRSHVFKAVNGFDESFFAHMEEIDLCWRLNNLGYGIVYNPESTVFHVGGATLKSSNPKKTYLNFRNSLFTIVKNAKGNIAYLIFIRLILDGIAGIKFLFDLRPLHTLALVKAHFSFYANLPRLLKERKKSKQKQDYYTLKSIVWRYYINKKETYTRL